MDPFDGRIKGVEPVFADAGGCYDESDYIMIGVPFDATVSHRPGAASGPSAIREESYSFETYLMDLGVDLEDVPISDLGDLVLENTERGQRSLLADLDLIVSEILGAGKTPIVMGGDHSVTVGSARAFFDRFKGSDPAAVIVDAHLDFRESYMDNPNSHASVNRRLFEMSGSDSVVIIGPRSASKAEMEEASRLGLRFATSREVSSRGIGEVIAELREELSLDRRPLYLSIDIDGLDPSCAPGTGTPEPWGLDSRDVLHILEELGTSVRAMDVVEISPAVEKYITPGLAGKLIRQFIGIREGSPNR